MAEATRVRNLVHADLVVLMPGYQSVAKNLVAERHRRSIARRLRRLGGVQAGLALGRLARLRALDAETRALVARIAALVCQLSYSRSGGPEANPCGREITTRRDPDGHLVVRAGAGIRLVGGDPMKWAPDPADPWAPDPVQARAWATDQD